MARSPDFFKRFILSCFSRRAAQTLTMSQMREDALLVMTASEMEAHLATTLDEMIAEGKLERIKGKDIFRIKRRV
ncbi:MAG: hypothetical protein AB1641_25265 [Thermodesulfobacteriota bacterium]